MKSGGFFRITNYGDFGADRSRDIFDNLFKSLRYFAIVGGFAALVTNKRRYVFNYDNAAAHICRKSRKTIPDCSLTHKTGHLFFLRLKFSVHSKRLGKYAVISHNYPHLNRTQYAGLFLLLFVPAPDSWEKDNLLDTAQLFRHWLMRLLYRPCLCLCENPLKHMVCPTYRLLFAKQSNIFNGHLSNIA